MSYNEQLASNVVDEIKSLTESPFVNSVEEHFAGYFSELGLSVFLKEDCSLPDFERMANAALCFLNKTLPKGNDEFEWMLFFYKDQEQVGLFFPGDELGDNCGKGIT